MENKKQFFIQINGISESVTAVDALNKQLDALEKRIKALEGQNIKVSNNSESIREEISAQKELNQLKKEEAAQQRLIAGEYDNTMKGMKQNLSDLKTVINSTDLGDSDSIKKMSQDAKVLNDKLKDIEQSYGQFGRNVGNYANGVAEGLKAVVINVGGVDREFKNAREASRTLGNELKAMAINGEQGTKAFKDMQVAVAKLNSDIKDATVSSKAMDNLLDTMQSFTALGQVGQGFSALFGFDDDQIEKSIQKLVALQNVMQGIEKINQQMNSSEGIGGWLSKGNQAIDNFVAKLTGAATAQKELNAANTAGVTASKSLAAAEEAQAVATNTATVATKALSMALKAIGIGLVISAVATLIAYWDDIYDYFTDTIPVLKNLEKWFDKIRTVAAGVGNAIINYMVQPLVTLGKVIAALSTGKLEEIAKIPSIISEGFKKQFDVIGNYQKGANKEIERQQKVHNDKMLKEQKKTNDEWLKDEEAKNGKSLKLTQDYVKKQQAIIDQQLKNSKKGSKEYNELVQQRKELQRQLWDAERTEREKNARKAKQLAEKEKKASEETQRTINQLELRLMRDGLNKKMMQLDEEERQTINKLEENGRKTADEIKKVQELYNKLRVEEVKQVLKTLEENVKNSTREIKNMQFDLNADNINLQVEKVNDAIDKLEERVAKLNNLTSNTDLKNIMSRTNTKDVLDARDFDLYSRIAEKSGNAAPLRKLLDEYYKTLEEEQKNYVDNLFVFGGSDMGYDELASMYEEQFKEALNVVRTYGNELHILLYDIITEHDEKNGEEEQFLATSFTHRLALTEDFYRDSLNDQYEFLKELGVETEKYQKGQITTLEDYLKKRQELEELALDNEIEKQRSAEDARYENQKKRLDEELSAATEALSAITDINSEKYKEAEKIQKDAEANIKQAEQQHQDNLTLITEEGEEKRKNIRKKALDEDKKIVSEYFETQLGNYRDFQSKLNDEISRQPVYNKSWGIINVKETRKNFEDIKAAADISLKGILHDRAELQMALVNGWIGRKTFETTKKQLIEQENDVRHTLETVAQDETMLIEDFKNSAQAYIQAAQDAIQAVFDAIWNSKEAALEKEQEQLDKEYDMLDEQLNKQEQLIDEHKNAVDSIEDELATARGSRRQHLIDQLNAEMEAERAAAKEKKRLEKEQQKLQDKQDKLDEKRKKQEYKRNIAQAIVNGAMAVTYAGLNTWPIPAVPMMKMAAAMAAAQLALVLANKPYRVGGQLEGGLVKGKRHTQGGVPVGNTGIEVEGDEMIIRRESTMPNIDLLNYINKSQRKLDLDDFIDFYSSGKIKKSIMSSNPRTKYASGGVLPTLNNDYNFDDRLLTAFEDYSNRPIYVAVTEIESKMDSVRNVRALAGMDV